MANLSLLPQSAIAGLAAALAAIAAKAHSHAGVPSGPATDLASLGPVVLVLGAFVCLLYLLLFNQSATAFSEHARLRAAVKAKTTTSSGGTSTSANAKAPSLAEVKYGGKGAVLAADRAVANFLEQTPPFLLALLLHAALVSASGAARCGWIWLGARAIYPFVFAKPFPAVLLSTLPAYGCVGFMLAAALLAV